MLAAWRIDALFRRNDVQFNVTANLLKYNELGKLFNKKKEARASLSKTVFREKN